MSRLVVVSNRVPVPRRVLRRPPAGLPWRCRPPGERGGIWMGWSGKSAATTSRGRFPMKHGNITFALTDLTDQGRREYYSGFANRVLWPICHYRLDLAEYGRQEMAGYFRVNRFFAHRLAPLLKPTMTIWVHDYHLIPLAAELRQMGCQEQHRLLPSHSLAAGRCALRHACSRGDHAGACRTMTSSGSSTDHDLENFARLPAPRRDGRRDRWWPLAPPVTRFSTAAPIGHRH